LGLSLFSTFFGFGLAFTTLGLGLVSTSFGLVLVLGASSLGLASDLIFSIFLTRVGAFSFEVFFGKVSTSFYPIINIKN